MPLKLGLTSVNRPLGSSPSYDCDRNNGWDEKQGSLLLNEQGVIITSARLITPGHCFELAKLKFLMIMKDSKVKAWLSRKRRSFRLVVSDAPGKNPFVIFETQDAGFIMRIEQAMNEAAAASGGERLAQTRRWI